MPASDAVYGRRQVVRKTQTEKDEGVPTTQPAKILAALDKPYRFNPENIIQMVYELSYNLRESREEMIAAQYGLEEFKANLSRFEPFVKFDGDMSEFPERRDSRGRTAEVTGGIQKETFEGAILRLEGGASSSHVEFGDVTGDQDEVESGSGGLVRARIEVPFVGSRKRQDRVISQAFQESQARKAKLNYLKDYRSYVRTALRYYYYVIYALNYKRVFERELVEVKALRENKRVKPEDRARLDSWESSINVSLTQWQNYYDNYIMSLLAYVGVDLTDEYVLEEVPPYTDPYLEVSRTPQGRDQMLAEAYLNNPRFRVLNDAIKDAKLKREVAIRGQYDITAFLEGTQFAFGAETFDDRVGGWQVGAGLSVRLNDRRVLAASRLKAEAEVRQFQAQIEAERLDTHREIITEADEIIMRHEMRGQIEELIKQKRADYEERVKVYLNGNGGNINIEDVLDILSEMASAEGQMVSNSYNNKLAELDLMMVTGEVYKAVGMNIEDISGNGNTAEE